MSSFAPVPAIGSGSGLSADIAEWVGSAPLRELVMAFDGSTLFDGNLPDVLARLDAFSDALVAVVRHGHRAGRRGQRPPAALDGAAATRS